MPGPSNESEIALAGRYRLESIVGCGGMSQVYRAVDERLSRTVAVKLMRPEAGDGRSPTRFEAEVCAMSGMDHPGVVRLLDAGIDRGRPYLVMDLVEGGSLADLLRRGPLPEAAVSRLAVELAGSLAYLHDQGVIHRDIKPGNILISRDGTARLADFGIARLVDGIAVTGTEGVVGTAPYLAPEQVRGERVGPPADIYALGLILLECRTGRREYTGVPTEAALARLARSPRIPRSCPAHWRDLLAAMTALDPAERPDAHQVVHRLRAGMVGEPAPPRQGFLGQPVVRFAAAACVLLAGAVTGSYVAGRSGAEAAAPNAADQVAGAVPATAVLPPRADVLTAPLPREHRGPDRATEPGWSGRDHQDGVDGVDGAHGRHRGGGAPGGHRRHRGRGAHRKDSSG